MKTIWLLLLLAVFIPENKKSAGDFPSGLMVDFIREPDRVQILDAKPEFSWIVPDDTQSQTAYQIMVSSSKGILIKDEADLWNSNKALSSRSTEIEYSGRNLSDNSTYFWKVRIWNEKGKPSSWSEIQSFKTGILKDYATTPNRLTETIIKPQKLIKTGDNKYFADFGRDAFGNLVLEINNPAKRDTIIIHLGEKIAGINRIDREPGGTIRYHRILLPVDPGITRYIPDIPPDARNTGPSAVHLPDSIGVITPFRYCEIENCRFEINPENVHQKVFSYYFENGNSAFISSDTVLNKIWDISKYTIKATSFSGLYIDGDRERIPYEADAYINQLGHYYTDREYSLARLTN
jgi:hypothetical protein